MLDDVISTGSTLQGMHLIMDKAGAITAKEVGILTEGDRAEWRDILSLGHLPLFWRRKISSICIDPENKFKSHLYTWTVTARLSLLTLSHLTKAK